MAGKTTDFAGASKEHYGRKLTCAKCGRKTGDIRGRICGRCAFPNGVKVRSKPTLRDAITHS